MEKLSYRNKWLRYLAALTGSLITLFIGRPFDLIAALSVPVFYLAFIVSTLIALFLVHCVHRITLSLDDSAPWEEGFAVRLCYQISLGILSPAFIDLAIITIYFKIQGNDIMTNGFLWTDFPVVLLLLTVWNSYYGVHYMILYLKNRKT